MDNGKSKVLFVGHGNPMHAIESNRFTREWRSLGRRLGRPEAVVSVSAHWETDGTSVTSNPLQRTIHDFYGFPQALFDVRYDPSGSPDLAREIAEVVGGVGLAGDWGLDHGTWAVLRHVFPAADVPVIQISLDGRKSAAEHFELARQLRFLREKPILFIGSGNIVHNLQRIDFGRKDGEDWAIDANELIKKLVVAGDSRSLIDYESLGENVRLAVPTREHFLPLLYFMALREEGEGLAIFNDEVELGSISMTSFEVTT
jgi:4,5-DOPA dioxygenase extradiol